MSKQMALNEWLYFSQSYRDNVHQILLILKESEWFIYKYAITARCMGALHGVANFRLLNDPHKK